MISLSKNWTTAFALLVVSTATAPFALAADTGGQTEAKPLYWVAPMDPTFRRDQPGKSPMGMDLVPVYADDATDEGMVRMSSTVRHNMGVKTARVRSGQLSERVPVLAYVKVNEDSLWHAYPRVEGWVTRMHVQSEGQQVAANDPLYEIYSPALVNAQDEYVSALQSGNQLLIRSAAARLRTLAVSDKDIHQLDKTRKVQQNILVRSPQQGVVSMLAIREGHFVTPGTALLQIADLQSVWVSAEVFEGDVANVAIGDQLELKFDYLPATTRTVNIDFISPILDPVTRTLEIRASVPNTSGLLKPNMFGEAILNLSFNSGAVLVPKPAVIRSATQNRVVLVLGDGSYKSVAVELGRVGSDEIEVTSGLRAGDQVVVSAQFLIDSESSISTDFRRMDLGEPAMDHSVMNHSSMDHSVMNHSSMDHSVMNHSSMDHSAMDHSTMDHSSMKRSTMDQPSVDHSTMDHSSMKRSTMDQPSVDHSTMDHSSMDHSTPAVWTIGVIRSVDKQARTLNLVHEPIPEWQWPAMTMTMDAGPEVMLDEIRSNTTYRLHVMPAPDSTTGYLVMHAAPVEADAER